MGSLPSGGISYALGSSMLEDEDNVPQADRRANAPMQIVQKIKVLKLSRFLVLFSIFSLSWPPQAIVFMADVIPSCEVS